MRSTASGRGISQEGQTYVENNTLCCGSLGISAGHNDWNNTVFL